MISHRDSSTVVVSNIAYLHIPLNEVRKLINREWEGQTFLFREDGYFNMTKAAQQFGKEVQDFFKLGSVQEYIEEMEKVVWEK